MASLLHQFYSLSGMFTSFWHFAFSRHTRLCIRNISICFIYIISCIRIIISYIRIFKILVCWQVGERTFWVLTKKCSTPLLIRWWWYKWKILSEIFDVCLISRDEIVASTVHVSWYFVSRIFLTFDFFSNKSSLLNSFLERATRNRKHVFYFPNDYVVCKKL